MNSTIEQALWKKGLEGISGLGEDWKREVWFRGQYSAEGRKHGIRGELIG